jgi:hypothetical protein
MERFDVHSAAELQRILTTKDTKHTEKILFRLRDLCDLGGETSAQRSQRVEKTSRRTLHFHE